MEPVRDNRSISGNKKTIQIFVGSPSDVQAERQHAFRIIDRLERDPFFSDLHIQAVGWDITPHATPTWMSPQQTTSNQRLPLPSECDVAVFIFWSRIGIPLAEGTYPPNGAGRGPTGSLWEFYDALEAGQRTGRPWVLTYRNVSQPPFDFGQNEEEFSRQIGGVKKFFESFRNECGEWLRTAYEYTDIEAFIDKLEYDLRSFMKSVTVPAAPQQPPPPPPPKNPGTNKAERPPPEPPPKSPPDVTPSTEVISQTLPWRRIVWAAGLSALVASGVGAWRFFMPPNGDEDGWAKALEPFGEFVVLRPGTEHPRCFLMGSPPGQGRIEQGGIEEHPQHEVCFSGKFAIGAKEVTFAQYDRFVSANGHASPEDKGWGRGDQPVIIVNWSDARDYAGWLSEQTGIACRLPTEAEWEYAARAGTETAWYWGDDANGAVTHAWYSINSDGQTHPVGEKAPNAWGLHDTAGNVWEWMEDCWHENYEGAPADGSAWLEANAGDCNERVRRGGSWSNFPVTLRSASREWRGWIRMSHFPLKVRAVHGPPADFGFRVVCRPRSSSSTGR